MSCCRHAGYCLPLDFNQPVGLCEQFKGSPRVCAASIDGMNTKSAFYWLDNEIFNIRAPHTDKTLTQGSQSFETLQLYMVNWACKQIGENVRQRSTLSPAEKQQAACNFVWRRDQEIQNESLFSVPAPGYPWGTFMYKPPGKNLTTFMFKGVPKKQCTHDYDCRGQNTPGDVYTCCDYCEDYFNRYCEVDPDVVFKFCMEKVQCVCNSVQKTCSKPRTDRCPKNEKGLCTCLAFLAAAWNACMPRAYPCVECAYAACLFVLTRKCAGEPLCHPAFNDGMYFPVHGAPCSSAAKLGALKLAIPTLLLLSLVAAMFP